MCTYMLYYIYFSSFIVMLNIYFARVSGGEVL